MEEALPEGCDTRTAGGLRAIAKNSQVARFPAIVRTTKEKLTVASHPAEVDVAKSGFAKEHLRSYIERVERLEEERAALTADIREVYSEAKGQGFDSKIMRQVVRMRKLDKADFQEQEAMLDLYLSALGMR